MATAIKRGEGEVVLYTTTATQARGDVIDLGGNGFTGIVIQESVASGATTEVAVTGLYEVTKTTTTNTWVAGARLGISSGTVAANAQGMHRAYSATTSTDTTALVIINTFSGDTT